MDVYLNHVTIIIVAFSSEFSHYLNLRIKGLHHNLLQENLLFISLRNISLFSGCRESELGKFPNYFQYFKMQNGLLTAMPSLATWIFSMTYSFAIDRAIKSEYLTILSVRRLSVAICECFYF